MYKVYFSFYHVTCHGDERIYLTKRRGEQHRIMAKISFVFISGRGVALTTHPPPSRALLASCPVLGGTIPFFPRRAVDQPSGKVSHAFRLT